MIKNNDGDLLDIKSSKMTDAQKAFYDGYDNGWVSAHNKIKPKLQSIKACAITNRWDKSEIARPYYDMICELLNEGS